MTARAQSNRNLNRIGYVENANRKQEGFAYITDGMKTI